MGQLEPNPPREVSARGRLRVGDAGRQTAIGLLKRALHKGQLSLDEFEHRVTLVYAATIRHELRPALEDLPEYQAARTNPRLTRYWLD
jgi:hypothetical protein